MSSLFFTTHLVRFPVSGAAKYRLRLFKSVTTEGWCLILLKDGDTLYVARYESWATAAWAVRTTLQNRLIFLGYQPQAQAVRFRPW